ncbi:MAG: 2Fe-2S iron-sulfur cluster-binding protein [Gallionella sp.]|nr:2Fe-2S iron-sulfur cluster-binding protein [Gallionella sp.]MDH4286912.1 2Fe-2S iron-sulfur cluster-binding protein [Gallionella sp.]
MEFSITLLPDNCTFTAEAGETIFKAAKKHGHNLPLGCADGVCGLCKALCCKAR